MQYFSPSLLQLKLKSTFPVKCTTEKYIHVLLYSRSMMPFFMFMYVLFDMRM